MKEIYNEGRVVGLNNWELYVRQLLSMNPEATPMSEREWLASMLSESNSMILKIASGTTQGYHDYPLPSNSDLCGCTLIHGYMFEGEVTLDDSGYWGTSVDEYGKLIANSGSAHPETPGTSSYVPTMPNPEVISPELRERCKNYLKLTSGLAIQPGEWVSDVHYAPLLASDSQYLLNEDNMRILAPVNDSNGSYTLNPDLSKSGFIRIAVSETITSDVYVFLHGFVLKTALNAVVSPANEIGTRRPQDGDYLGPTIFPWACPIMFTVTTNIINTVNNGLTISLVP